MKDVPIPELILSEVRLDDFLFGAVTDRLRYADGQEIECDVLKHPGVVVIVPIDDQGRWLLIRQYRHGAGRVMLELPAGTAEEGELPLVTAHREIREETGFAAGSLVRIGGVWAAPSFLGEYVDYFVATELRADPLPQDDDENLSEPIAMTPEEVLAAIDDGTIEDAKTIVATMLWQRHEAAAAARGPSGT